MDPRLQYIKKVPGELVEFTEDILRGIKDRKLSEVVVMDFAKAFDKVL